jgi:hypothetical protein
MHARLIFKVLISDVEAAASCMCLSDEK